MNISWYINRLRAMSLPEILWRLEQKKVEKAERSTFGKQQMQMIEGVFYEGKEDLTFHMEKLPLSESVKIPDQEPADQIRLLAGYDYDVYKKDWHAGFQTKDRWPLVFSYDLSYKQRDEIGDARTNWELNRHFQFALLACNYYHTGKQKYLTELSELFTDWNAQNPFLYGISWTSVMEIAIRDINWMYTLGFLSRAQQKMKQSDACAEITKLCEALRIGIINMTTYISAHYSRYSSANNHVIVEAAAMGIAGIVMACEEWYETAFSILQCEIGRQNYRDGVNKELSLHYQSFFMEAVGLLVLTMQVNHIHVPQNWRNTLGRMSRYVADCQGNYGEAVVFGDDDEGKILGLEGGMPDSKPAKQPVRDHYSYVLQLMSIVLPERYTEAVRDMTLRFIIPEKIMEKLLKKPYYRSSGSVCYEDGGVSLLKSKDGRALIGIDHGALGFGSIAAHGHADALSFQLYLEGEAVFADAGTYIYHIDLESRNAFRRTENHNTVAIDGKDQSEMLGAFLWGKRAETKLLQHNLPVGNSWGNVPDIRKQREGGVAAGTLYLEAEHNGYAPLVHRRRFEFDGAGCLRIYDKLLFVEKETAYQMNFLLGEDCVVTEQALGVYEILTVKKEKIRIRIEAPLIMTVARENWISTEYGVKKQTKQIHAQGKTDKETVIVTTIEWENGR